MAYTPINWQTGDTITAAKLNKMDNGWGYENTQLFSETVTTADSGRGAPDAQLAYSQTITVDTITVTYDGTEYTCPRIWDGDISYYYGGFSDGPNFTEYPFFIWSGGGTNILATETAGEHTISVSDSSLQTSPNFDKARGYGYENTQLFSETVTVVGENTTLDYAQPIISDAIVVVFDGNEYSCINMAGGLSNIGDYGAPYDDSTSRLDFSDYPFNLYWDGQANLLTTETAGSHTIAVTGNAIVTSSDFETAAQTATAPAIQQAVNALSTPFIVTIGITTFSEVYNAIAARKLPFVVYNDTVLNHPRGIELVVWAQRTNFTVSTIAYSSGSITVKTYTAASYSDPLES